MSNMIGRRREEWRVPLGNWPSRPRHSCTIKYQTNLKKSCLTESIVCRYLPTFVMVRAFVERLTTLLGQIFLIERLLLLSLLFGRDISFPSSIIFSLALHFYFHLTEHLSSRVCEVSQCYVRLLLLLFFWTMYQAATSVKKKNCRAFCPPHPLSFSRTRVLYRLKVHVYLKLFQRRFWIFFSH